MSVTRYSQARTLVRRLCRLPGEERADFREKVKRLRAHFEQFNVDTSNLCQWLMGLRKRYANPNAPGSFGVLGDFLLEPKLDGTEADESTRDRWRLHIFDDVAGFRAIHALDDHPVPTALRDAMTAARMSGPHQVATNSNAARLFGRLQFLDPAHRLVLLKSAAEWIVARYLRGVENWVRQRDEWEKEKREWETRHPELTKSVQDTFTDVFKSLVLDKDKPPGVKNKRPRICPHKRLKANIDNCIYAGQKGHGPLCWNYAEFVKEHKASGGMFHEKHFADNVQNYLKLRANKMDAIRAKERLYKQNPKCKRWFGRAWAEYLLTLNLNEQTLVDRGEMPHCLNIGKTFEDSECRWNPHTELCNQYRRAIVQFDDDTLNLEPLYREWRRDFLAGPRKPSFRYPSSRELPMPKIFGAGFHEVDFDRSILRLRLDDMQEGQWIEFGFTPWPRDYKPSRAEVADLATSVHVHFVGTRARVGFRFDAPHKQSHFRCTQDEIDEIRSRQFPRRAQDQQFLDAARKHLLKSFDGDAKRELRLLAVDLGETGAYAAVYQGETHVSDAPLPIIKINKIYDKLPEMLDVDRHGQPAKPKMEKGDPRGVRKQHVARHLTRMAEKTKELVAHRQKHDKSASGTAGDRDLIGLKRHVAWMIRDWTRHNAARITALAEQHNCDLIAFESMRGFFAPGYDKLDAAEKKRWLAMFAYGRIRRKVTEKAVERGMRVITLPYHQSSQYCSACGHAPVNERLWKKNKKVGVFKCQCGDPEAAKGAKRDDEKRNQPEPRPSTQPVCTCSAELNSDANAARVLARVFWGEIVLPSHHDEARKRD